MKTSSSRTAFLLIALGMVASCGILVKAKSDPENPGLVTTNTSSKDAEPSGNSSNPDATKSMPSDNSTNHAPYVYIRPERPYIAEESGIVPGMYAGDLVDITFNECRVSKKGLGLSREQLDRLISEKFAANITFGVKFTLNGIDKEIYLLKKSVIGLSTRLDRFDEFMIIDGNGLYSIKAEEIESAVIEQLPKEVLFQRDRVLNFFAVVKEVETGTDICYPLNVKFTNDYEKIPSSEIITNYGVGGFDRRGRASWVGLQVTRLSDMFRSWDLTSDDGGGFVKIVGTDASSVPQAQAVFGVDRLGYSYVAVKTQYLIDSEKKALAAGAHGEAGIIFEELGCNWGANRRYDVPRFPGYTLFRSSTHEVCAGSRGEFVKPFVKSTIDISQTFNKGDHTHFTLPILKVSVDVIPGLYPPEPEFLRVGYFSFQSPYLRVLSVERRSDGSHLVTMDYRSRHSEWKVNFAPGATTDDLKKFKVIDINTIQILAKTQDGEPNNIVGQRGNFVRGEGEYLRKCTKSGCVFQ